MAEFDSITWFLLSAVGGGSVLGMLYVLALRYDRERSVHDLRARVIHLRTAYAQRIADIAARESQVELVPEEELDIIPLVPLAAQAAKKAA